MLLTNAKQNLNLIDILMNDKFFVGQGESSKKQIAYPTKLGYYIE